MRGSSGGRFSRTVSAGPDGSPWVVVADRSGAWPGWRWLDRLGAFNREFVGALGAVPGLLGLLALPARTVRAVRYRRQHRTDWDVLVYRDVRAVYRAGEAAYVEHCPSRAAAVARAEELSRHVARAGRLPD